jgi:hypothetical protein
METPVSSMSPVDTVTESLVSVHVPLLATVGAHPEKCDWVSYLRWRHVDGPSDSAAADRILIAPPGIFEGAGTFGSVARNTVVSAAARQNGGRPESVSLNLARFVTEH